MTEGRSAADDRDKDAERARYEARGRDALSGPATAPLDGAASLPPVLRAPYEYYERAVARLLRPGLHVLELGAGMGEHTGALVRSGAEVTCLDIAPAALALLETRFATAVPRLHTLIGDIEALPLPDASVDVVTSAGALSYGDPARVASEIHRVLRPGGAFICVDSLNHNPIYRLNRWRHYRRGERSRSTLLRIPTLRSIAALSRPFSTAEVRYFGAMTWGVPLLVRLIGQGNAARLSDRIDAALGVRRSAFKFVLVAEGMRPRGEVPLPPRAR